MSETKQQAGTQLTTEQAEHVGGGDLCDAASVLSMIDGLTRAYESLVGFTSHVIERVITASKN